MTPLPRVKGTGYLRRLDKELDKVALEHQIPKEEVEELVDAFFAQMKEYITDPRMPKIQITNFGTFRAKIGKIEFIMKKMIKIYRLGKRERDEFIRKFRPIWRVRRRLVEERMGIATWKKWKKLKIDE